MMDFLSPTPKVTTQFQHIVARKISDNGQHFEIIIVPDKHTQIFTIHKPMGYDDFMANRPITSYSDMYHTAFKHFDFYDNQINVNPNGSIDFKDSDIDYLAGVLFTRLHLITVGNRLMSAVSYQDFMQLLYRKTQDNYFDDVLDYAVKFLDYLCDFEYTSKEVVALMNFESVNNG